MSNNFRLRIFEADNTFYEGDAESLVVPAVDGEYGVLAHHQNVAVAIEPGLMRFTTSDVPGRGNGLSGLRDIEPHTEYRAFVSSGIMRVEDNDVLLLVDSSEWIDEIDAERAMRAEEEAREKLLQKKSRQEYVMAEASLKRAIARQRVKGREGL